LSKNSMATVTKPGVAEPNRMRIAEPKPIQQQLTEPRKEFSKHALKETDVQKKEKAGLWEKLAHSAKRAWADAESRCGIGMLVAFSGTQIAMYNVLATGSFGAAYYAVAGVALGIFVAGVATIASSFKLVGRWNG